MIIQEVVNAGRKGGAGEPTDNILCGVSQHLFPDSTAHDIDHLLLLQFMGLNSSTTVGRGLDMLAVAKH